MKVHPAGADACQKQRNNKKNQVIIFDQVRKSSLFGENTSINIPCSMHSTA